MSILSHLSAHLVDVWLRELARVTKPGGIVMVTFHGPYALRVISDSAEHQAAVQLTRDGALDILARLPDEHIVMVPYPREFTSGIKVGTPEYGTTFIDSPVLDALAKSHHLEPLAHVPGGLRGFQDIVVLISN
jgi:hypothetical protein